MAAARAALAAAKEGAAGLPAREASEMLQTAHAIVVRGGDYDRWGALREASAWP